MTITDALLVTGQIIGPLALVAGGFVAGYIYGTIGIITTLFTRRQK